jgi:hypothetical protein
MNAFMHRHSDQLLFTKIKDSINAVEIKFNVPNNNMKKKKKERKKYLKKKIQ